MIFVTVGMHTQSFDRLLRKMDEIAGETGEEVVMQIGHTGFRPKNAKWFDFTTEVEIKEFCRKARVVVTHAAVSILDALDEGTAAVAVPRLRQYNEHMNDHQLDFARVLEKSGRVVAVYNVDTLPEVLARSDLEPQQLARDRGLVEALKRYMAEFERS